MKIQTLADVPDELAQAWLQHLRDFDTAHPECHFSVVAQAPDMSVGAVMDSLKVDPPFNWQYFERISERRREAIDKLRRDLAWRGPGGRQQNFVCLPRELAEALAQ